LQGNSSLQPFSFANISGVVFHVFILIFAGISCDPKVPKLEDLFQQLNTHHDLHQFMTELRTEFKNIANKEN